MNPDRILHDQKHFAELTDEDVETFLAQRKFKTEHLNLEFKAAFPTTKSGKFDIREICRYIAGFSNEEGGLVIYGVADQVRDLAVPFPQYVVGVATNPSIEDLSQWVRERIHPLVQSPAIRPFMVQGKTLFLLKIPPGAHKPYSYCDPATKALTFFKKSAASVHELNPDEIRGLYESAILEQAHLILGAQKPVISSDDQISKHQKIAKAKLEDIGNFGFLGMYALPTSAVDVPVSTLEDFLQSHRDSFSEFLRYSRAIEAFQDGVFVSYRPRALGDIKSTAGLTLYRHGFVALDSQTDPDMGRPKQLHAGWLTYETQRHLQLTKALLAGQGDSDVRFVLELELSKDFQLVFSAELGGSGFYTAQYTGDHHPIKRTVSLADIHDHDGPKRNIVMPAVQDIMDEVGRIFGLSTAPPRLWNSQGYLAYVKGLENQR